jgi:putative FmdB family regulatory protein
MPIYEYKCKTCDYSFEKLVFAGDDKYVDCPECGSRKVKKQMSSTRFISVGTGSACSSGSPSGFS